MKIREITTQEKREIDQYIKQDYDILLGMVFACYEPNLWGYKTPKRHQDALGRMDGMFQQLRELLCIEWELCKKTDTPSLTDSTNLIVAIADTIIASGLEFPAPVILAATTIVKLGVRKFCECSQENIQQKINTTPSTT